MNDLGWAPLVHRLITHAVLFLLAGLLTACQCGVNIFPPLKSPAPNTPQIQGRVIGLRQTDRAYIVASTSDGARYATYSVDGAWKLEGLKDGIYAVQANAPGYTPNPASYTVVVKNGIVEESRDLDFVFTPPK